MRIEVDYRLEDLEELYVPEVYAAKPAHYAKKMRAGLGGWIFFVAIAIGLWMFNSYLRSNSAIPPDAPPARDFQTDLFTLLLPGSLGFLFTCGMLFRLWRTSKWKRKTKSPATKRNPYQRRIYAVLIWLIIAVITFACINGAFALEWRLSKGEVFLLCWGPWILALILLMAASPRLVLWQARRTWLTNPGFARHLSFELDDWGLKFWDNLSRTEKHWTTFVRARETENLLVLLGENNLQYFIPKRCFTSEADVQAARALFQNKLQNTTFLVKPLGFPMTPRPVEPIASNP